MKLAAAAMTPLIEKLGNVLASELTLEKSVQKDIASLERELKVMTGPELREVAEVPQDRLDEGTKLWASDVRELSYDMADAIDAFTLHVPRRGDQAAGLRSRLRGFLDKTTWLFTKGKELHQIAGAVRGAKDLAKELCEIHQRYAGLKLQDASTGASDIDPRLTAMYSEVADLVGIDGARDELIKVLTDRSIVDVKTVSIVGFGGLGKTTLAKAVFDKIIVQFDCGAFVSVSRNPDITKILQLILFELDKQRYANINGVVRDNMKQLIDELRGFLLDKRYLIVIDDLWDEVNWKLIKCAFPKNTCRSRLITTTHISKVSEASCSSDIDIVYMMKPLSEDDSLRLFHSRIFHNGNICPPEYEQVSRDILEKCGGVPLTIITIASLLASGNQVKPKDQWVILLNSIGHGLKGRWRVEDMHKILSLSYYDLPSHLKPCLLYLSIFHEDYVIKRNRLIPRWIAEGLIQYENTSGYDSLFEIGESYYIELVNRSMIQSVGFGFEGSAKACRVHDMVLDLIRSLSSKENFVTVWDNDERTTSSHNMAVVRRLSIQNNTTTCQATAITSMSKLRSFTMFSSAIDLMPSLTQFQVLRVLDLEDCDLSKCGSHVNLRHVGKLSHLRYLGLRDTRIRELPVEVGKLQFLQTLDLRGSGDELEVPWTITGLRNLMCLRFAIDTRLPIKGLGNLTSLEELGAVTIDGDDAAAVVSELGHLTGLRVLKLLWNTEVIGEAFVQSLGNLRKLQSLNMSLSGERCDLIRSWAPPPCLRRFICNGGWISVLPEWINNNCCPSLTFLDICVSEVGAEDLKTLGTLSSLRVVRLRNLGRIDEGDRLLEVNANAFPCARNCRFINVVATPSMFPPGAMPLVQCLRFCVRAWDFAGGGGFGLDDLRMGHLPSLEKVEVDLWYREEEDDTKVVEAALRQAVEDHPNRLALDIHKWKCWRPSQA